MRIAINIEFTDEEALRFAEDAGRRVVLRGIHDLIGHLGAIDSTVLHTVAEVFGSKVASEPKTASEPEAYYGEPPQNSSSEPAPEA